MYIKSRVKLTTCTFGIRYLNSWKWIRYLNSWKWILFVHRVYDIIINVGYQHHYMFSSHFISFYLYPSYPSPLYVIHPFPLLRILLLYCSFVSHLYSVLTTGTYTLQVKLQTYPHLYKSTYQCLVRTFQQEGVTHGLYRGTIPSLAANIAENSVLFCAYGVCQSTVAKISGKLKNNSCIASAHLYDHHALYCSIISLWIMH